MNEELSVPQVIDLDALLQPVSEESPSGESLRYSGLYDEIVEARRSDDNLSQGEWQTELKVADYRKVVELAVPALTSKAKDLQVAAWLSESLIKNYGFAGLRDSLKLVSGLQDHFWDTLHPVIDEGDMEGRANAISWLDVQGANAIKTCPITGGPGYSYNDWLTARSLETPANFDSLDPEKQQEFNNLKAQAETDGRVTGDLWKIAVGKTKRAQAESINYTIEECWEAFAELNRVIENPNQTNVEEYQTLQDSIQETIEEFEEQHPNLTEALRIAINTLVNAGI